MTQLLTFLAKIKSFWRLYANYGYDGETIEFIIDTYEKLLCERTKTMSKPTYQLEDILSEIDKWYCEQEDLRFYAEYNHRTGRIDFSVEFRDMESKDDFLNAVISKMTEKIEQDKFLK